MLEKYNGLTPSQFAIMEKEWSDLNLLCVDQEAYKEKLELFSTKDLWFVGRSFFKTIEERDKPLRQFFDTMLSSIETKREKPFSPQVKAFAADKFFQAFLPDLENDFCLLFCLKVLNPFNEEDSQAIVYEYQNKNLETNAHHMHIKALYQSKKVMIGHFIFKRLGGKTSTLMKGLFDSLQEGSSLLENNL